MTTGNPMTDEELRELDDLLSWSQPIRRDLDRAQEVVRELLQLREEDRQWDKHSLVEIVKERDRLRTELAELRAEKAKDFAIQFGASAGNVGSANEHEPDCGCPICDDSNRGNR